MAFIPLRLSAGGYHAKNHWSCILGFNITFFGFAALHLYMNMGNAQHYSLISVIISSLLVWSLASVEAVNKPLKDEQKGKQRKQSIIIVSINIAVTLLFYTVDAFAEYSPFLAFYNSGALAASIFLVVAMIANRKAGVNRLWLS
jgi:accessory gene regulator B